MTFRTAREIINTTTASLEKSFNNKSAIPGLATGHKDLDNLLTGLHGGDLVVVAGRPAMGKSALVEGFALTAAKEGRCVAYFSLATPAEQLIRRLISKDARIELVNIRRGFIMRHEWNKLAYTAGSISEAALHFDDTPRITARELTRRARELHEESPIDLIVVDYLQLLEVAEEEGQDARAVELGDASKELKILARELNVPVVAVSALNRNPESRVNKRPLPHDLRDSGSVEDNADIVMFVYREEYYAQERTPEDLLGTGEIIVAKNRHGPTGTIELRFFQNIVRFDNLDAPPAADEPRGPATSG